MLEVVKELVWFAFILDDKAVSVAFKEHGIDKGFGLSFTFLRASNNITDISLSQLIIFGAPHSSAPVLIVHAQIVEENSRWQPSGRESSIHLEKGQCQFIPAF